MRSTVRLLSFLLPLLLLLPSCATTGIDFGQINIFSTEEEIQLGKQFAAEIDKQEPILDNPTLTEYVNDIGQRVAAKSDRPDIPYSFKVVDNDEQVNAFALPGGPIYVYSGLLKLAENEAELAGVLGHEVAHIAARHSTEQLTKAYGYSMLSQIVLGENPGALTKAAGDIVGSLGMLKFSRDDEIESDTLGVHYMHRAGYNPNAMTSFMQKLGRLQTAKPSRVANLLSTHPLSEDRLNAIRQEIGKLPQGQEGTYNKERYNNMIEKELR